MGEPDPERELPLRSSLISHPLSRLYYLAVSLAAPRRNPICYIYEYIRIGHFPVGPLCLGTGSQFQSQVKLWIFKHDFQTFMALFQCTQHTLSPQALVPAETELLAQGKSCICPEEMWEPLGFGKHTRLNTRSKSSPGSSEPRQCTESERQGWLSVSRGHVPSQPSPWTAAASGNLGESPRETAARRDGPALLFRPAPSPGVPLLGACSQCHSCGGRERWGPGLAGTSAEDPPVLSPTERGSSCTVTGMQLS